MKDSSNAKVNAKKIEKEAEDIKAMIKESQKDTCVFPLGCLSIDNK
jgi:hypothetical protein